ncbi:transglutaminase family protein [Agaribacterium haliotis]|uniref:transglutaminase family protein n=1 Tax=Agaribacterium haliotis TaxID=2013869 RepID=UPI000BB53A50|nr:transglutaminase family protein [Agaribacterium haliotis]
MKYRIQHVTEYQYADRVSHCYNLAHMVPRNTLRQRCLSTQISVSPEPAHEHRREDYFGNQAYHFEVQRPHQKLSICSSAQVETSAQPFADNLDFGWSCSEVRRKLEQSRDHECLLAREFLLDSPMVKTVAELKKYAEPSFADDKPLLVCVRDLTKRIFNDFSYCPEATTIATPLEEVLKNKKGVCQDFAHLQIACLRALGFPAKYISGYIETLPPPGQEKLVGSDASHAWLSVYSPGEGWVEFDPTNDSLAGEQHIITAWGRDYFDVTPLRGVIYGGGDNPALSVSVDVARL